MRADAMPWEPDTSALEPGVERGLLDRERFVSALVTLADRLPGRQPWVRADPARVAGVEQELEREIVALILDHFGPVTVLAEEHFTAFGAYAHTGPGAFWFALDPLDGSKSYASGQNLYAVSVAGCVGDRPVFGFVYQPHSGVLYSAARDAGAYADGRRLSGGAPELAPRRVSVGNGVVVDPRANPAVENLLRRSYELEHMACTSLRFCQVAEGGRAGLVKQVGASGGVLRVWGMAAGALIAAEAGARCVKPDGTPWLWTTGTVLVGDDRFLNDIKEQQ
ncbi:inositol monophosphatase family protein [Streptomyces puniciscabiei]